MKRTVDELNRCAQPWVRPIRQSQKCATQRVAQIDRSVMIGMAGLGVLLVWVMLEGAGQAITVFWRTPSLAWVIGGSIFATIMACPGGQYKRLSAVVRRAFQRREPSAEDTLLTLVALGTIARREGLLALDGRVKKIQDRFLQRSMFMAIDGADPSVIESVMGTELASMQQRHHEGRGLLEMMARTAPALGMVGTLIGLVVMVGGMENPSRIGPGMAVALLTTLYGLVFAHVFCWPLARKLANISRAEVQRKMIILEGVLSIQSGDHPRMVEQKLRAHLPATESSPMVRLEMETTRAKQSDSSEVEPHQEKVSSAKDSSYVEAA